MINIYFFESINVENEIKEQLLQNNNNNKIVKTLQTTVMDQ